MVPSGVRLVSDKKVYSFGQFLTSGGNITLDGLGYVTMTRKTSSKPKDSDEKLHRPLTRLPWEKFTGDVPVHAPELFERKVKVALEFVADLRKKMAEGRPDAGLRKAILKSRAAILKREWAQDDHIPELLGE